MYAYIMRADLLWLNDQVLISCSKDGKVIQQLFSDALRPVDKAVSLSGIDHAPVQTNVSVLYVYMY